MPRLPGACATSSKRPACRLALGASWPQRTNGEGPRANGGTPSTPPRTGPMPRACSSCRSLQTRAPWTATPLWPMPWPPMSAAARPCAAARAGAGARGPAFRAGSPPARAAVPVGPPCPGRSQTRGRLSPGPWRQGPGSGGRRPGNRHRGAHRGAVPSGTHRPGLGHAPGAGFRLCPGVASAPSGPSHGGGLAADNLLDAASLPPPDREELRVAPFAPCSISRPCSNTISAWPT